MGRNLRKQFAVYDSDTPVTLKHGQGHQTWYEVVNPTQDYNSAKFDQPLLSSVRERTNIKVFVKSGNTSVISLE